MKLLAPDSDGKTSQTVSQPLSVIAAPTTNTASDAVVVDNFQLQRLSELGDSETVLWERLRATQPELATPFFSWAFANAVDKTRRDGWVAVLRCGPKIVGYLPFHKVGALAYPIGRRFNDAHGVVCAPHTTFDWFELLRAMGAKGFEFHSLVGRDRQRLASQTVSTIGSFCCVLGDDSTVALQRLEQDHRTIAKQGQKTRKMSRELGTLRLEVDCPDKRLLSDAIERKREHYRRTNILDLFLAPWTRDLIHELAENPAPGTRVMLSVLWAGDQVVASHVGLREGSLLHYWFPSYDCKYAKYSPGTALFTELVRVASEHEIAIIDMGYGEQPYKMKQTDQRTEVATGLASESAVRQAIYRAGLAKQRWIKSLPMKETLKYALRRLHPRAGMSDYR